MAEVTEGRRIKASLSATSWLSWSDGCPLLEAAPGDANGGSCEASRLALRPLVPTHVWVCSLSGWFVG